MERVMRGAPRTGVCFAAGCARGAAAFGLVFLLACVLAPRTAEAVPCGAGGCPEIEVGSGAAAAGSTVTIPVTLRAHGNAVSAVNVLIRFAESDFGTPDPVCTAGVSVPADKTFLTVGDLFPGQVSFNIFGTSSPIPDGTVLANCTFTISADASSGVLMNDTPEITDTSRIPQEYDETLATDGTITVLGAGGTPTPTPPDGPCVGDCDEDGRVAVSELVTGVNIAVERVSAETCPGFGSEGGGVGIDDLLAAVGNSLGGCPGVR
jgi:hypothetical protein